LTNCQYRRPPLVPMNATIGHYRFALRRNSSWSCSLLALFRVFYVMPLRSL